MFLEYFNIRRVEVLNKATEIFTQVVSQNSLHSDSKLALCAFFPEDMRGLVERSLASAVDITTITLSECVFSCPFGIFLISDLHNNMPRSLTNLI